MRRVGAQYQEASARPPRVVPPRVVRWGVLLHTVVEAPAGMAERPEQATEGGTAAVTEDKLTVTPCVSTGARPSQD